MILAFIYIFIMFEIKLLAYFPANHCSIRLFSAFHRVTWNQHWNVRRHIEHTFEYVWCCFCGTQTTHFLIELWLVTKNRSFMTIANDLLNVLILTKHLNTFQNWNCMNRRLWWLSGGLPLALSIRDFWNLIRALLWMFRASCSLV